MRRFVRYLKRGLLILSLLVAISVVVVMLYIRTKSFAELLRHQLNDLLATGYRGQIAVAELDTSSWGELILHRLTIKYGAATIVHIPEVRVGYSLVPLLWREVRLKITAIEPQVHLERNAAGEWNLLKALTARSPTAKESGSSRFDINLGQLMIRNGAIELAPQGGSGPHYRFERASLDAGLALRQQGLEAQLARLQTRIMAPAMPPVALSTALSYTTIGGPPRVTVHDLRLDTQASSISAAGKIRDVRTFDSDLEISINKLAAADLRRVVHNSPWRDDLSGRITLSGALQALHAKAELASGSARLESNFQGDLTRKAPSFELALRLTRLDLSALQMPQHLAGLIELSVYAHGQDTKLQSLNMSTELVGKDLRVGAAALGQIHLNALAQGGKLQFGGELRNGPGRLALAGTATIAGNPHYYAALKATGFNTASVLSSGPLSDLNGQITAEAIGSNVRDLNASIGLRVTHSVIARAPLDASVQAHLAAGTINVLRAQVVSRDLSASLAGEIGIIPGKQTKLAYQIRADQLAPWLKLVGIPGDARLNLSGTAGGMLQGEHGPLLHAQGNLALETVHLANLTVADMGAVYNLQDLGQPGWPRGSASAELTRLEISGTKLHAISAQIRTTGGRTAKTRVAVGIRDNENHLDRVEASLTYFPHQITGQLAQVLLVLPDGTWRLAHPASFIRDRCHVAIEHFALLNGARRLTLDAALASSGAQSVELHAHMLDLALLRPFMPQQQQLAGNLSSDLVVGGTSSSPAINASVQGRGLMINGNKAGDLDAAAQYRFQEAQFDLVFHQDVEHQLRIAGHLPMSLNWVHGFAASIGNNEQVQIHSAGIQLASFGAFAPEMIKNAGGLLLVDVTLTGSPFHPIINGSVAIHAAHAEVVTAGVNVSDLEMQLLASPDRLSIAQLSAQAGEGTIDGKGWIALQDRYTPGSINLAIQFRRWPAIATEQYQAKLDGELHASGTAAMPVIEGNLDLLDTTIRPDLNFLSASSAPPPDDTIVILEPGQSLPSSNPTRTSVSKTVPNQSPRSQIFNNVALNIRVNLHRNTWIRHENAEIELDGGIDVKKRPGGPISLVGEVDTVRGWLAFHGKRFNLVNGRILFTGGSAINPTLSIDAQYLIEEYTIDLIVAGTAAKPEIKLQSQPQLAQADILSLILFGTTTNQLGQGQKTTLQQQAQSLAVGAAGQALSQSLGLQSLGIDVNGESVGFGHYIGENTYVSVAPNLGTNTSSTPSQVASIQYFLRRWLSVTTATMSDGSRQVFVNVNKRY